MGGVKDIWFNSKEKLALDIKGINERNMLIENVKTWEQSSKDKKLEFFSYTSGFSLGCEVVRKGNANKVHQGKGPFLIKFKDIKEVNSFF
jgi:hypothetical protein